MKQKTSIACLLLTMAVFWGVSARAQTTPVSSQPDTLEQKITLLSGTLYVGTQLYQNRDKTPESIADELIEELRSQYTKKPEPNPGTPGQQALGHKQYYIYSGPKDVKAVALTFDDGPNQRFTPQLIELLKRKGVPATFFFLGEQVKLFPGVAREVAEDGFEIGNHTYTHRSLRKLAIAEAADEIDRTQQLIAETTGVTPRIVRPPYGECNAEVVNMLRERGLGIILWSVDTDDYKQTSAEQDIVGKVMQEVSNGAIILMHDRNTKTIQATEKIIDQLAARGYKFYTVSDLLAAGK